MFSPFYSKVSLYYSFLLRNSFSVMDLFLKLDQTQPSRVPVFSENSFQLFFLLLLHENLKRFKYFKLKGVLANELLFFQESFFNYCFTCCSVKLFLI
jgi:hypothetical protein